MYLYWRFGVVRVENYVYNRDKSERVLNSGVVSPPAFDIWVLICPRRIAVHISWKIDITKIWVVKALMTRLKRAWSYVSARETLLECLMSDVTDARMVLNGGMSRC